MRILLFSILILIGFGHLSGQNTNPELNALIQKAFEHYPNLIESNIAIQASALRTDIQRAGYRPTVTSQASVEYIDPVAEAEFGGGLFQFQPHDNYVLGLNGSGLLFDFGKTKSQIDKAIAEAAVVQNNHGALENAVAYQVAQLYYGLVFTRKRIEVQTEQFNSLQANEDLISAKLKNGDALELDLMNAKVAKANAKDRLADLNATVERQQALLFTLTGEPTTQISTTTFGFQDIAPDIGVAGNPDIAVANAKIGLAEQEVTVNKRILRPSITYSAGVGFRNGYQPDITDFRFNWAVGAGISYPLYVGGRDRDLLKLSQLNLLTARSQATGVSENVSSELARATAEQRAAKEKLLTAQTTISQAQTALDLAQTRYKNGVATNVDVLTAQSNLGQAKLSAIVAEYQLCLAGLEIGKLNGLRFW